MDTFHVKFHSFTSWCTVFDIFWKYLLYYSVKWSSLGNSKRNWLPLSQYYLKCNMCNEKETDIGKILGDNTKGFKVRINQQISNCKSGVSSCKFLCHVYNCGIKNNCLEEPVLVFSLSIIIRLNKSDSLEIVEKHFHSKNHNAMNNPGRN